MHKLQTVILVCLLFANAIFAKPCKTNSDCNVGYSCKQSVECNDFGCSAPTNECTPSDDGPTQLTSSSDGDQGRLQTTTQTKTTTNTKVTQAATQTTSTSVRPSRLIIRTQNDQDSILRFESSNNDFGYEFRLNPETKNFNLYNGAKSVMRFNSDGTVIDCTDDVTLRVTALNVQNLWNIGNSLIKAFTPVNADF